MPFPRAVADVGWPSAEAVRGVEHGCEGALRLTEFWSRMDAALGPAYARSWAQDHVITGMGERTVAQLLADGWDPKTVWRGVWAELELHPRDR